MAAEGEGEEESSEGFSRSLVLRGRRRRGEGESSRRPPRVPNDLALGMFACILAVHPWNAIK